MAKKYEVQFFLERADAIRNLKSRNRNTVFHVGEKLTKANILAAIPRNDAFYDSARKAIAEIIDDLALGNYGVVLIAFTLFADKNSLMFSQFKEDEQLARESPSIYPTVGVFSKENPFLKLKTTTSIYYTYEHVEELHRRCDAAECALFSVDGELTKENVLAALPHHENYMFYKKAMESISRVYNHQNLQIHAFGLIQFKPIGYRFPLIFVKKKSNNICTLNVLETVHEIKSFYSNKRRTSKRINKK